MSEAKTIRELQMAVVEAAIAWHSAPGTDEYLDRAVGVLLAATKTDTAAAPVELVWVERTFRDVRVGDRIRPTHATAHPDGALVTARYLPPVKDGSNAGNWHMAAGERSHWDDRAVKPGEVWLCMDGGTPRNLDPDFPVEIQLLAALAHMLEAPGRHLGTWADRMDVATS